MSRRHSYSLSNGGDWHEGNDHSPVTSSRGATKRGGGESQHHQPTTAADVRELNPPLHHGSSLDVPNGSHDASPHRTSAHLHPAELGLPYGGGPLHHHPPLPGRILTRRKRGATSNKHRRHRRGAGGFCHRFYAHWLEGTLSYYAQHGSLLVAVALWYALGVVSIGTSKVLLSDHELGSTVGNVPPCYLTLQQLLIGSTLLRFLIRRRFLCLTAGLQPWPQRSSAASGDTLWERRRSLHHESSPDGKSTPLWARIVPISIHPSLVWAAVYFCLGFLATNVAFAGSAASFVETVKASEPLTSAAVAVGWGIETLSPPEVASLLAIVAGVLLSTLGHTRPPPTSSSSSSYAVHTSNPLGACAVVMASNLCFSFRGLFQKLFRATPEGSAAAVDDLNLQFRMQQVGAALLVIPTAVWDGPTIVAALWHGFVGGGGGLETIVRYTSLALLNGCAFAGYNLSSTYLLSRLTVVHHAALNCLRRIFAIAVTSLLFRVPVTLTGACGIAVSVIGFLAFSHYKVRKQQLQQPQRDHSSVSPLLPTRAKEGKQ